MRGPFLTGGVTRPARLLRPGAAALPDACRKGHPYTPENTRQRDGFRSCRECDRAYRAAWNARNPDYEVRRKRERREATEAQRAAFWDKVDKTGGCWEWTGRVGEGYGRFDIGQFEGRAHRLSWEWLRGPIPGGMVLDHLCRNRRCVNPDHLEPVTAAENSRRGLSRDVCKRGHDKSGVRDCTRCAALRRSAYKARQRATSSGAV